MRWRLFTRCKCLLPGLLLVFPAAFGASSWAMYRYASLPGGPMVRVQPVCLERAGAPGWLSQADLAELEGLANRAAKGSHFYAPDLPETIAGALASSVWVTRSADGRPLVRIRRRFPGRLDCEVVVRMPLAAVDLGNRFAVDAEAVRLPLVYRKGQPVPLPVIHGVRSFPPDPGAVWKDPCVVAAIAALKSVACQMTPSDPLAVKIIEVEARDNLPYVSFITACDLRVAWGVIYNPGEEPIGLATPAERLAGIRRVIREVAPERIEFVDASVLPVSYKPK